MLKQAIPEKDGFSVKPEIQQSFATSPGFFKLTGPGRLIRLVQFGKTTRTGEILQPSRFAGDCWFEERLFQRLRASALAELATQNGTQSGTAQYTPRKDLMGLHMKFNLRDSLAVSRDWNDFDAYVSFSFGPNEAVVALVGKIKGQSYYSVNNPGHAGAESAGISLPGGEDQYVIDFSFPANRRLANRINGPVRLQHVQTKSRMFAPSSRLQNSYSLTTTIWHPQEYGELV